MNTKSHMLKVLLLHVGILLIIMLARDFNQVESVIEIPIVETAIAPTATPTVIVPTIQPSSEFAETSDMFVYEEKFPETITVRITGQSRCTDDLRYTLREIPLKSYVKAVLASEWGYDWDMDSLRAGAVAVKMYAIHAIQQGGDWIETQYLSKDGDLIDTLVLEGSLYGRSKWPDAHVYDCDYDMAFNPDLRFPSTDTAVDETWDWVLLHADGTIFNTHFLAWYENCGVFREVGICMGQWNSKKDAELGMTWQEILRKYYPNGQLVLWGEPTELESELFSYMEYTIQSGDTISTIAQKFYGKSAPRYWDMIFNENKSALSNVTSLKIGLVIRIPDLPDWEKE